eukprot:14992538-Ditylum_brightwellii.AAC.1
MNADIIGKTNGHTTSDVDISDIYRNSNTDNQHDYSSSMFDIIADFAETVGFPIVAGVQSDTLCNFSPTNGGEPVIPFAEHDTLDQEYQHCSNKHRNIL